MTEAFSFDTSNLTAEKIRQARAENPKLRERDLAYKLGISEGELVASFVGHGVRRIRSEFDVFFPGLEACGEVMTLTRNESAVHEKIGVFDKFVKGRRAALMLGKVIDMRMFPDKWVHAFAVEKTVDGNVRRSMQFFDAHGDAVNKVHTRPDTNLEAWEELVQKLIVDDQSEGITVDTKVERTKFVRDDSKTDTLRARWAAMTDVHQFFGLLQELELERQDALEMGGEEWAWQLDPSAITSMLYAAANQGIPIMCFVGNHGCIQIHGGPVHEVKEMGPWVNIMDPTFHLHLRADHLAEVWTVRKPSDNGIVTSVEGYDKDGVQIIQFFGTRIEGRKENLEWRELAENLPRLGSIKAAGAAE
ncbi:MAG: hemin-degrading factor [Rhodobacteraceae bacterium]|nr:hemin-degrading factor [Paracoccaceae bacterium]